MPSCYGDPLQFPALRRCSRLVTNWENPNCSAAGSSRPLELLEPVRRKPCKGRNIYIDLGANWCNTLDIFQHVPNVSARSHPGKPWHVYAFEASPLIAPYVEKCCAALNKGAPLPPPPVPPTASSGQLLAYAEQLGCAKAGGKAARFACMSKQLSSVLQRLEPQPWLSSNASLLSHRLRAARLRGCAKPRLRNSFHLLPAAAGHVPGTMRMAGTPEQMLRGGAFRVLSNASRVRGRGGATYEVAQVDIVRWLLRSFTQDDFVVLKMIHEPQPQPEPPNPSTEP